MLERILRWVDGHLFIVLLALLLLRGGFLFGSDLNLIGDESYYWDWSRRPDWCYYSKPPMVAWLIGIATWLFGDYTAVVRLPTLVLGTVFLAYFHATAKAFYGARAAAMALLLMLATPINVLANFLMTIDPPLYCFWIMALYYLRRALFDGDARAWLWAGCASAAALLSKQAAIALPILLLVFLAGDPSRRHCLKRQYWLYLLPMVLAAAPILWWNQQHDWVMFGHSKGHFGSDRAADLGRHFSHARDFMLYQLLLLSPVICLLVIWTGLRDAWGFRRLDAEQRFLWLMGPLLLLAVLLLSLLQKVQGNWPMPFYFSGLILLAGRWAVGAWRKTVKFALGFGFMLVGMTYVLPLLLQVSALKGTAWDPTKRFESWRELAVSVHNERLSAQPGRLSDTFIVALGHRYLASQLGFYLPDHPQVYRYEESGLIMSQYEVWPGPERYIGKNAFIVGERPEDTLPQALKDAFVRFRFVAQVANPNKPASPYYIYLGENLTAWPEPARLAFNKE
ncbi:glycosyltransferase family 39 protein [Methylomonas sp. SURF-2]|uniref:Glycosyltransferase family 39 protein n=1 Tax=Methylomonas subterranea TaxID=2952225 RepID=A0ABT1TDZ2_9GAMM|nr:glycosyltransferase family 39 protein [Methylomonas sp. SURF-2]MCQ8103673.1 glycosyltransferase family 39 protein [Methylomonas sp. SURF-2]